MNKFEKSLRFISDKILPDSPFYGKIFLVGGCVRDELLGERYSDLDLLINMPNGQKEFVEYMCQTYPKVCKGPFYYQRYGTTAMDVEIDNTITLVECVEPHIESYDTDGVTLLETRFCTLEEDAMRRDYTCNALYKNLSTGEPHGHGHRRPPSQAPTHAGRAQHHLPPRPRPNVTRHPFQASERLPFGR